MNQARIAKNALEFDDLGARFVAGEITVDEYMAGIKANSADFRAALKEPSLEQVHGAVAFEPAHLVFNQLAADLEEHGADMGERTARAEARALELEQYNPGDATESGVQYALGCDDLLETAEQRKLGEFYGLDFTGTSITGETLLADVFPRGWAVRTAAGVRK